MLRVNPILVWTFSFTSLVTSIYSVARNRRHDNSDHRTAGGISMQLLSVLASRPLEHSCSSLDLLIYHSRNVSLSLDATSARDLQSGCRHLASEAAGVGLIRNLEVGD